MHENSSISGLPVVFRRVIRKHQSKSTQRIHYKVVAELSTKAGTQKRAYWFSAGKAFLRRRDRAAGKALLRVGCSALQRAEIRKLVRAFNTAAN
jgi:hypothetical protein